MRMMRLSSFLRKILLAAGFAGVCTAAHANEITVFAAASLKEAIDAVAQAYSAESGTKVVATYAGSSTLARQIERGAPADAFISASTDWMDHLEAKRAIIAESRFDLLSNRLVLVTADEDAPPITLSPETDLVAMLAGGKLAMALTNAVPAGIYGKAALTSLGQWEAVVPHVAETDNVRAALALVGSRAAPLGIVYETDALAAPRVHILARFDAGLHPAIRYPVALTSQGQRQLAQGFLDYLRSKEAQAVFEAFGFLMVDN
jgi:molybdate transport system substrate-binding protein